MIYSSSGDGVMRGTKLICLFEFCGRVNGRMSLGSSSNIIYLSFFLAYYSKIT